jgi:hypothetical protein
MQANGDVDQPLVKQPRRTLGVLPQVLPDFVRLEEVALIEVLDPFQVPRVEWMGRHVNGP